MTITLQQMVRDVTQLLKTRGARLAALGGSKTGSDYYVVKASVPSTGILRITIDFDQTKLNTLGEIASGAESSVIPVPDRV